MDFISAECRLQTNPDWLKSSARCKSDHELFLRGRFCLACKQGKQSGLERVGVYPRRREGDNADARRGDSSGGGREGVERSVHTMYMAYTQSCAEHMRHRSRGGEGEDKAFGDGCWMGYRGEQGEASTSTGGRGFNPLPGKGEGGVEVNGIRQHAKSKSEVQPPLQKYESL